MLDEPLEWFIATSCSRREFNEENANTKYMVLILFERNPKCFSAHGISEGQTTLQTRIGLMVAASSNFRINTMV
jgi:hypothetical protein